MTTNDRSNNEGFSQTAYNTNSTVTYIYLCNKQIIIIIELLLDCDKIGNNGRNIYK